jgi:hypothetical protein
MFSELNTSGSDFESLEEESDRKTLIQDFLNFASVWNSRVHM